jgi:hypothetical protein
MPATGVGRAPEFAGVRDQSPFLAGRRRVGAEGLHGPSRHAHRERAWVIAIEDLRATAGKIRALAAAYSPIPAYRSSDSPTR